MLISKTDMARVIVQAIYHLSEPPLPNNADVLRIARRDLGILQGQYDLATRLISSGITPDIWPEIVARIMGEATPGAVHAAAIAPLL